MPRLLEQLQSSKVINPNDVALGMENLLKPVSVDWLGVRVNEFLKGFYANDREEASQALSMVDWLNALKVFPQWAIEWAIIDYNRSETKGFPKPADLATRANKTCAIFRKIHLAAKQASDVTQHDLSPYERKKAQGFQPGSAPPLRPGKLEGRELENHQICEAIAAPLRTPQPSILQENQT